MKAKFFNYPKFIILSFALILFGCASNPDWFLKFAPKLTYSGTSQINIEVKDARDSASFLDFKTDYINDYVIGIRPVLQWVAPSGEVIQEQKYDGIHIEISRKSGVTDEEIRDANKRIFPNAVVSDMRFKPLGRPLAHVLSDIICEGFRKNGYSVSSVNVLQETSPSDARNRLFSSEADIYIKITLNQYVFAYRDLVYDIDCAVLAKGGEIISTKKYLVA